MIECMFDSWGASRPTPESAALVEGICAAARAENRAAAARLVAIGRLFGYRLVRCTENEDWAIDTMDAVAAEFCCEILQGCPLLRRLPRQQRPPWGDHHAAHYGIHRFIPDLLS